MCTDLVRAPGDEPNAAQAVWPASAQHLHLCDNFFIPRRCLQLHAHFILFFKMAQVCLVKPLRGAAHGDANVLFAQHILPDDLVQRAQGGAVLRRQHKPLGSSVQAVCHRRGKAILALAGIFPPLFQIAHKLPHKAVVTRSV